MGYWDVKVLTRGDCKWTRSNTSRYCVILAYIGHDGCRDKRGKERMSVSRFKITLEQDDTNEAYA